MKVVNGIPIVEANRFSKFQKKASELVSWKAHLAEGGIPSEIVLTDFGYALYRTGLIQDPFVGDDDEDE